MDKFGDRIKLSEDIYIKEDAIVKDLRLKIEYHRDRETEKQMGSDYPKAMYHQNMAGAFEEVLIMIKNIKT